MWKCNFKVLFTQWNWIAYYWPFVIYLHQNDVHFTEAVNGLSSCIVNCQYWLDNFRSAVFGVFSNISIPKVDGPLNNMTSWAQCKLSFSDFFFSVTFFKQWLYSATGTLYFSQWRFRLEYDFRGQSSAEFWE